MSNIIAIVVAYLLGSLSMSILLSKLMNFPDPRTQGSGNAGATNILRTVGKHQAAVVLAGDVLKGLLAVLIGRMLGVDGFMLGLVAVAAVVGHIFPLYFKFKGGKGVATMMGAVLGLSLIVAVIIVVIWAVLAYFTKYVSLGSLAAAACAPVFLLIFSQPAYVIPAIIIAALIFWKHKDNIQRLRSGTENKTNLFKS